MVEYSTNSTNINSKFIPSNIRKISMQDVNIPNHETLYHTNISLLNFNDNLKLDNINNEWLVNLSNFEIPRNVKAVLQLGQKFT